MNYGLAILETIVFPGLLFTAVVGLVASWIDRKVTARVQMRKGPRVLQPFYDILKYFIKETCIPAGVSTPLFLAAPLIVLAAATVASTILWHSLLVGESFVGDLIVVLYLLTMPAMAVVLGSLASRNPLASLGGSREMKLVLSYELPFVLATLVPVIKARSIGLDAILAADAALVSAPWALKLAPSGILALLVVVLCMQAKLTLIPFDMPEAETELSGGAYIEYSGPPLGIYKLTRAMMLFIMPTFVITVFCGGLSWGGLGFVLWYVALLVVIVLIRNTAPRVRTDQAVRFFWGPVTVAALIAVILAWLGW